MAAVISASHAPHLCIIFVVVVIVCVFIRSQIKAAHYFFAIALQASCCSQLGYHRSPHAKCTVNAIWSSYGKIPIIM